MGRSVVHLVHGTWPRGVLPLPSLGRRRPPLWFEDGSAFREEVAGRLDGEVAFVRFDWSGRNSLRARSRAARGLAEQIARTAASQPDARQVVIAHSHGGNVAAHAVALLDSDSRPAGIATLATPFLHVRERSLAPAERAMIVAAGIIMFLYGLIIAVLGLIPRLPWPKAVWPLQIAFFYAYCLLVPLAAYSLWRRWRDKVRGWQSPGPPAELDLLILRAPGDEASLALASAGFFTLASRSLWALLALPVRVLGAVGNQLTARFGKDAVPALIFGSPVVLAVLLLVIHAIRTQFDPAHLFEFEVGPEDRLLFVLVCLMAVVPASFFVFGAFAVLTVPPLLALSSVLLLPFGFEFAVFGPSVEVTAESAPEGRWPVEILPPADTPAASLFGRHGIHSHPGARARVAEWLNSILSPDAA